MSERVYLIRKEKPKVVHIMRGDDTRCKLKQRNKMSLRDFDLKKDEDFEDGMRPPICQQCTAHKKAFPMG